MKKFLFYILILFFTSNIIAQDIPKSIPRGSGDRSVSVLYTYDPILKLFIPIRNDPDSSLAVRNQDRVTPSVFVNFNRIGASTLISDSTEINDTLVVVDDTTGIAANTYVIIFSPLTNRFYKGNVLSVKVDTLVLDTPIDSEFPIGSFIDFTDKNLNVDGSDSTQVFGLRGVSSSPIGLTMHVTRIIFTCVTEDLVDLTKFGDIAGGLTKGIVARTRDGIYHNLFNLKTNQELAGILFDWSPQQKTNPVQGKDGFIARLTIEKLGVVIRLDPQTDFEFLIQDDLTDLTIFEIMAEGYFTAESLIAPVVASLLNVDDLLFAFIQEELFTVSVISKPLIYFN